MTERPGWMQKTEQFFLLLFRAVLGIGVLFVAILIFLVLRKSLKENQYVLQAFHVPEHLEKNGLSGQILARKIQDEVVLLKAEAASTKIDSVKFAAEKKPEMDMAVMGLGLSLNTITYYCRELFGRPNRQITGEVVDYGSKLALTVRMTGYDPTEIFIPVENGDRFAALENLTKEGGKSILRITDPYRLAICEYHAENYEAALELVRGILADPESRDHKWAYLAWGHVLRDQNQLTPASEKYLECLKMDSSFRHALQALGWTRFQQQDFAGASAIFERLVAVDPTEGFHYNSLAQSRRREMDYEGASVAFEKVIAYKPDLHWPALNYAGMLMNQMGDTTKAMKWYRHAQEIASPGVAYYYTAAILYVYENKLDSALWAMERILDFDPDNITALGRIAGYHYNYSQDYRAIVESARKVDKLKRGQKTPFGDELYVTMQLYNYAGMSYYHLNQYDSSEYFAQQAISLDPETAYPHTTLAEAYLYQGKKAKFYEEIDVAMRLGFDIRAFLDEEPYNRVAHEARLQNLIDSHFQDILD